MIDALIQCDTGTRNIDLDSSFVCLFFSTLIVGIDVDQSKVLFFNITFTGQQAGGCWECCMHVRTPCVHIVFVELWD